MENINTVNLSLKEYNNLRDFQIGIELNHAIFINTIYRDAYKVVTLDEAVKTIAKENVALRQEINRLNEIVKTNHDIKIMNIWQFLKWKREI